MFCMQGARTAFAVLAPFLFVFGRIKKTGARSIMKHFWSIKIDQTIFVNKHLPDNYSLTIRTHTYRNPWAQMSGILH